MEIKFKNTKNGKRAYMYNKEQMRWFPMNLEKAEILVATGGADDITETAIW